MHELFFFKKPVHFTCKTYQHLCKSSVFGSLRSPLDYLHVLWLCQKLNVCTITLLLKNFDTYYIALNLGLLGNMSGV